MATLPHGNMNCNISYERGAISLMRFASLPLLSPRARALEGLVRGQLVICLLYLNFVTFAYYAEVGTVLIGLCGFESDISDDWIINFLRIEIFLHGNTSPFLMVDL